MIKTANKKPLLVGANTGVQTTYLKQFHCNVKAGLKNLRYKQFSRDCLPSARNYYIQQFPHLHHLKKSSQYARIWISVRCCFHEDRLPSLRINIISGAFRCFACGAKGSDVLAFHQQRYAFTFKQTVDFFNAWRDV